MLSSTLLRIILAFAATALGTGPSDEFVSGHGKANALSTFSLMDKEFQKFQSVRNQLCSNDSQLPASPELADQMKSFLLFLAGNLAELVRGRDEYEPRMEVLFRGEPAESKRPTFCDYANRYQDQSLASQEIGSCLRLGKFLALNLNYFGQLLNRNDALPTLVNFLKANVEALSVSHELLLDKQYTICAMGELFKKQMMAGMELDSDSEDYSYDSEDDATTKSWARLEFEGKVCIDYVLLTQRASKLFETMGEAFINLLACLEGEQRSRAFLLLRPLVEARAKGPLYESVFDLVCSVEAYELAFQRQLVEAEARLRLVLHQAMLRLKFTFLELDHYGDNPHGLFPGYLEPLVDFDLGPPLVDKWVFVYDCLVVTGNEEVVLSILPPALGECYVFRIHILQHWVDALYLRLSSLNPECVVDRDTANCWAGEVIRWLRMILKSRDEIVGDEYGRLLCLAGLLIAPMGAMVVALAKILKLLCRDQMGCEGGQRECLLSELKLVVEEIMRPR